jgi:hypothetical protein
LGGCDQTHRFEVRSDEPIQSAVVELNGRSAQLQLRDEHFATGELALGADADGRLVIHQTSGRAVTCQIGYVTKGEDEPHHFTIKSGKCAWEADG